MSFFVIHVKEGIGFLTIHFVSLFKKIFFKFINDKCKHSLLWREILHHSFFYFSRHMINDFEMLLVTVAWRLNKPICLQTFFSL